MVGSPETLTYLHTDHLGTPKFGTDATGTQVWAWAPDAFGGGAPSGSVTVNLRMAGQYYDAESTLFYNWNRYYNPATGRYISSDPIGLDGGINTFLYAAASPVMYIDPEGLTDIIPTSPPENIPGGPWSPSGSGQAPGTFYGPEQKSGGRLTCRWVPAETDGGPPGSKGYWKTKHPKQRGWDRFDRAGNPQSPNEAHPNPLPPIIRPKIGPPIPLLISPCITMPQLCDSEGPA